MKDVLLHIESIIFASPDGVSTNDVKYIIFDALGIDLRKPQILALIKQIDEKYQREDSILELKEVNERYQFFTKKRYHETIQQLHQFKNKKKLSQSALETLAIIAYKQPITKTEIEDIRGVNSDYTVQKLLERKLIKIAGKSTMIGRPLLYATTNNFMTHFGLSNLHDLPKWKDFEKEENRLGEPSE